MNIYSWIIIIASIVTALVIFLLACKFIAGKETGLIIFSVILVGTLGSVGLYVAASMNGTQILSSKFAAEYQVKQKTFRTTDKNPANYLNAAYAFYAENGVQYQIRGTDMLKQPESTPAFVEIYSCEAVDGYSWCYLKKGPAIRYALTKLSHDGNKAVDYEHKNNGNGNNASTDSNNTDTNTNTRTDSDTDADDNSTVNGTDYPDGNSTVDNVLNNSDM